MFLWIYSTYGLNLTIPCIHTETQREKDTQRGIKCFQYCVCIYLMCYTTICKCLGKCQI